MINPKAPDFSNIPTNQKRPRYGYHMVEPGEYPKVSIITSLNKQKQDIGLTCETLREQSFQDWEWFILTNDRTEERTGLFLENTCLEDKRIRVMQFEAGQTFHYKLNEVEKNIRGNYVLILESGVLLEPTALEKLLWFLVSHEEYDFVNSFFVNLVDKPQLENVCLENITDKIDGNLCEVILACRRIF